MGKPRAWPGRRRGRKVNKEFEEAVLGQLIFTSLQEVEEEEKAVVVANVIYSQDVVQTAAAMVKKLPQFIQDERVQSA